MWLMQTEQLLVALIVEAFYLSSAEEVLLQDFEIHSIDNFLTKNGLWFCLNLP